MNLIIDLALNASLTWRSVTSQWISSYLWSSLCLTSSWKIPRSDWNCDVLNLLQTSRKAAFPGKQIRQRRYTFNPLTAGVAYIRVFILYYHIKYHILNMLNIKCDINPQDLKGVDLHFVKSE